jgi:hypothetical protein
MEGVLFTSQPAKQAHSLVKMEALQLPLKEAFSSQKSVVFVLNGTNLDTTLKVIFKEFQLTQTAPERKLYFRSSSVKFIKQ